MRGIFKSVAAFYLGTTALTVALPAAGAVIDYPDGSNNTTPIVLTDNSTQLQVLTGSAAQSGAISESGGFFGIEKIGSGSLTLAAANTYTGGTTITAGTLQLGTGGRLASTGMLSVNGGKFDLNGKTQTVGGLTSAGFNFSSELAINGGTFTINQPADLTSFFGKVTGTGSFIFNGPGHLSVGGPGTSYSGNITINGGNLDVTTGFGGGDLTINGGSLTVFHKSLTFGTLSGTGGTINLGGSFFSFTGNVDSTFAGLFVDTATGNITKAGTGTLTLTGNSTAPADLVITAGTLQFGNAGASGGFSIFRNMTNNGTFAVNRSDDLTFNGLIRGTGALIKLGSGKLTLANAGNSYTGLTTISGGTLEVASLNGNVVDNGVLILDFNNVYGGVISGSGSVVATTGPVFLTATNT
jgi:autotransporter-associated beta strand protein